MTQPDRPPHFPGAPAIRACGLSLDVGYDLLASSVRRHVLLVLAERESPPSVDELSSRLEAADTVSRPSSRLVHVALPVLHDAGILEYEPAGAVELTPTGRQFVAHVGPEPQDGP